MGRAVLGGGVAQLQVPLVHRYNCRSMTGKYVADMLVT